MDEKRNRSQKKVVSRVRLHKINSLYRGSSSFGDLEKSSRLFLNREIKRDHSVMPNSLSLSLFRSRFTS
jgi:hypothetical protein